MARFMNLQHQLVMAIAREHADVIRGSLAQWTFVPCVWQVEYVTSNAISKIHELEEFLGSCADSF